MSSVTNTKLNNKLLQLFKKKYKVGSFFKIRFTKGKTKNWNLLIYIGLQKTFIYSLSIDITRDIVRLI